LNLKAEWLVLIHRDEERQSISVQHTDVSAAFLVNKVGRAAERFVLFIHDLNVEAGGECGAEITLRRFAPEASDSGIGSIQSCLLRSFVVFFN
jgi:hypothetical protein